MARQIFETTDILQLAKPHIENIDIGLTAIEIARYTSSNAHRSYDPVIALIKDMATGLANIDHLLLHLQPKRVLKKQELAWQASVEQVCRMLFDIFSSEPSTWYPSSRRPIEVLPGAWFKSGIRGIRVIQGHTVAQLINPRKSLFLTQADLAFLSRWIIEFHIRDEPNIQGLSIADLGENPITGARVGRVFDEKTIEPMTIEKFEDALDRFLAAAELAGCVSVPLTDQPVSDLFRKRWL